MISSETFNNIGKFSKVAIIFIIVFLLFNFIIKLKPYEAILLAGIIAVSILIIENIFYINNTILDPLNCDQCKINETGLNNVYSKNPIDVIVPNPLENNQLNLNTNSNTITVIDDNVENFDTIGATIYNKIKIKSTELVDGINSTFNSITTDIITSDIVPSAETEIKTEIVPVIKYINSKATNHTFVLLVACFLKGLLLNQVMLAQSQQLYVLMN
jgi:hypothetical protein